MKKIFPILFSIALLFRIIISFYDSYGDINIYFVPWVKNINEYGYSNFYLRETTANYPPLTMHLFKFSYDLGVKLSKPIMQLLTYTNSHISIFPSKLIWFLNEQKIIYSFIKLPFMIADLFLALGIFYLSKVLVKNKLSKIPILMMILILFNPAFFYNSTLWGQIDVLPITLAVWSIFFFVKNKFEISTILFTLGLLSKQTIGVILPIYSILFLRYTNIKIIFKSFLLSSVLFFLFFLPFYHKENVILFPFVQYIKIATTFGGNALSAHAYNFWWLVTNQAHQSDSTVFFNLFSAATWSKIFVSLICFIIIVTLFKIKNKKFILYFAAISILSMGLFLFSTRMHERHLLPSLPFLLISGMFSPVFYWLYIITSIIHFLNLYSAWGQPRINFFWDMLNNKSVTDVIIIIQIVIFFYALLLYLRSFIVKHKIKTK